MVEHLPRDSGGSDTAVEVLDHAVAVRSTGEIDIDPAPSPCSRSTRTRRAAAVRLALHPDGLPQ
ncbi:hypothetical protein ACIQV3_34490 [Streptomyces sp. NPDC099050]|uniref:hypothetical protein n=1 Tax=Streptomyces sp. NPDC099050 TaxID=3366100 RepID=UPI0037F2F73E